MGLRPLRPAGPWLADPNLTADTLCAKILQLQHSYNSSFMRYGPFHFFDEPAVGLCNGVERAGSARIRRSLYLAEELSSLNRGTCRSQRDSKSCLRK
jgi:hypothetical protein